MSYEVLARKYRPQSFEEVVGQEHITQTLKNAADSKRIAHGYLFSGMRGVGKTTMARILAKALNCDQGPTASPCNRCGNCGEITQGNSVDVIEIDGASNTSVDDIRELRENVLYAPARGRYKVYIIDEVHMLSKSAFNALLKTLEEPPRHVIFVIATTELHKVPMTIQSRCQCFQFRRIPLQKVMDKLFLIAEQEGFTLGEDSARLIGRASEGSMRDAQSLLDQVISFCGKAITAEETKLVLGVVDQDVLDECTSCLLEQDAERVLNLVDKLHALGVDLVAFCMGLLTHLRDLLMIKILKEPGDVVDLSKEEIEKLKPLVAMLEEDRLVGFIEHLSGTEQEVRRSSHPRILLEMSLVKMTRIQPLREFREVLMHLENLEKKFRGKGPSEEEALDQENADSHKERGETSQQENPPTRGHGSYRASSGSLDWEGVVNHANKVYPPVGSLLENGFLEKIETHRVIIGFKKKIHYAMAKEKREKILEMLESLLQKELKLEFSFRNGTQSAPPTLTEMKEARELKQKERLHKESLGNHVVQEALRIFKGKVLEVRDSGTEQQGG
jgi:DNA polymerase-3 subunit gamma/tau